MRLLLIIAGLFALTASAALADDILLLWVGGGQKSSQVTPHNIAPLIIARAL